MQSVFLSCQGSTMGEEASAQFIAAFVRANTRLRPVPHVPEILLHVADATVPLWRKTEPELAAMGLPAPFWAFAWAGGQALARYVLDHRKEVAGRRVLDLGAGSGLVAIAAAQAGAAPVVASDVDAFAEQAVALNAQANGVYVEILRRDPLGDRAPIAPRYDVILAGDLFYERETAERAFAFLRHHAAAGTQVLIGEPGRSYLPQHRLRRCCEYSIAVARDLEDGDSRHTTVWMLA
jgi:predicted nicotinamide N-methyase